MRLQQYDLEMYCKVMQDKTNKKYWIIPTKDQFWYWTLELINTKTWDIERIAWNLTLRDAYEYLRAFYNWIEKAKTLDFN